MSENKSRAGTEWEAELGDGDTVVTKDGQPCVVLKALQRLGQQAGLVESGPVVLQHVNCGDFGIFQCIYEVKFNDGLSKTIEWYNEN